MARKEQPKDAKYSATSSCVTCKTQYTGRSNHSWPAAQAAASNKANNCYQSHLQQTEE